MPRTAGIDNEDTEGALTANATLCKPGDQRALSHSGRSGNSNTTAPPVSIARILQHFGKRCIGGACQGQRQFFSINRVATYAHALACALTSSLCSPRSGGGRRSTSLPEILMGLPTTRI